MSNNIQEAKKAGAKVFNFEWINDFSAAKNYAIEKATGDWILFLDADEYFTEATRKNVRPLLETNYKKDNVNLSERKEVEFVSSRDRKKGVIKEEKKKKIVVIIKLKLIALIFIYYKRIFVIAILIAIFPLIMIFYCIDKMADGSAQTLSMWFNELLSNIFIQSIHCIMYTVLVQMGLEIYKADPSNWFLFLAAMLLLVPAEKILREIFGLGGTTLGKLGGMGMKLGLGAIAAAKLFGKSLKGLGNKIAGKQDKAFVDKMNKKFDKTQRKQNRADEKAAIRANIRKVAGRTELSRMEKLREKAYSTATKAREFRAKNAPRAAKVARAAKKAAAMGAGVAYGIAVGGGTEGLTQGMQFADELMGSKGKMVSKKKANIKTELSSAYKRKAAKGKGKK